MEKTINVNLRSASSIFTELCDVTNPTSIELRDLASSLFRIISNNQPLEIEALRTLERWQPINRYKDYTIIEGILQNYFPKAAGKLGMEEILLMVNIKKLDPENIRVGARMLGDELEIWMICKEKNYLLLERASEYSAKYITINKKMVSVVFQSAEQFSHLSSIEFIMEL